MEKRQLYSTLSRRKKSDLINLFTFLEKKKLVSKHIGNLKQVQKEELINLLFEKLLSIFNKNPDYKNDIMKFLLERDWTFFEEEQLEKTKFEQKKHNIEKIPFNPKETCKYLNRLLHVSERFRISK